MTVRIFLTFVGILTVARMGFANPAGTVCPVILNSVIQEIVPAVPPEQVREFISGLASDDYQIREKTQRSIYALGEKVLPQLRRASEAVVDAEARRRLATIVQRLEFERLTTARTVTVVEPQITALDAMRKICQRAGYRFRNDTIVEENRKRYRYNLEIRNRPFWEAMDTICNLSGLGVQVEDDGGVRVYYQDTFSPNISYSGPFRFVANQIQSNRFMQLSGLPRNTLPIPNYESLSINFSAYSEPKTTLIGVKGPWVLKLVDENGKNVPQQPIDPQTSFYSPIGVKSFQQNLALAFNRPAKEATKIKEIRAKASMMILMDVRPDIVIDQLPKSKGKKLMGRSAHIDITEVTESNGSLILGMTIVNPSGNMNDYQWLNNMMQRFEVEDAKGIKYLVNVGSSNFSSPQSVSISLSATPPEGVKCGPPTRFTLVEWISRTQEVEFTFKDIPLP
ncbi:MAG: hypothetical protein U0798_06470 [Gemmataceae bacterium]